MTASKKNTNLTAIDLFAGTGGTTAGLRAAGFDVLAAVENNTLAAESYSTNFPSVSMFNTDIRRVTRATFTSALPDDSSHLDLLAGCPPCQGFSRLRTRNGRQVSDDIRNDLVFDFLRLARSLRPLSILFENVPDLQRDQRFSFLIEGLRKAGYKLRHKIVDAAAYGVPQRRKRLILVGTRERTFEWPSESSQVATVASAIRHLKAAGESGDPLHDFPEKRSREMQSLIARIPKDGGSRKDLGVKYRLSCHARCDGFSDTYGRMAWNMVAPTITTGCVNPSKGRFLHPEKNRCITLREASLLQGFPADFHISLRKGKYAAAELIGNAVPPGLVAVHAQALKA